MQAPTIDAQKCSIIHLPNDGTSVLMTAVQHPIVNKTAKHPRITPEQKAKTMLWSMLATKECVTVDSSHSKQGKKIIIFVIIWYITYTII